MAWEKEGPAATLSVGVTGPWGGASMTEAGWLACDEPLRMLTFVSASISLRKRRLFAVAGARRVWGLLGDARSRVAVETGERFADGAATPEELAVAADGADEVQYEIWERA